MTSEHFKTKKSLKQKGSSKDSSTYRSNKVEARKDYIQWQIQDFPDGGGTAVLLTNFMINKTRQWCSRRCMDGCAVLN